MISKKISVPVLILAIALIGLLLFVGRGFKGASSHATQQISMPDSNISDTAFGGIFAVPQFNDSLPYYLCKKIEDSFKYAMHLKEVKNDGSFMSGLFAGGIGLYTIPKRINGETALNTVAEMDLVSKKMIDSFNKKYPSPTTKQLNDFDNNMKQQIEQRLNFKSDSIHKELSKDVSTYLALPGYNLKSHDTKFYIQQDAYYLAVVKWDTTVNNNGGQNEYGHYEAKPVKVRYAAERKFVLIPIPETTGSILKIVMQIFTFLTGVLIVYFFLGLPILFLINISKGKAFTEANIRILKQISTVSLIIAILTIATPYIFRLFFWTTIPEELVLEPLMSRITDNLPLLFITVVTFFISKAFKKGFKLQQEQDLTI